MPADVQQLLRMIAPALLLFAGCDANEASSNSEVVAKTAVDLGSTAIEQDAPKPAPAEPRADVGEVVSPKLDVPPAVAPAIAEPKPPPAEPKTPEVPPTSKVAKPLVAEPKLPEPARKSRPTCPSRTSCTDKASAKKHAVSGAKYSLGCPLSAPVGVVPSGRGGGLDEAKTKERRAEGTKDACCYTYTLQCPGGRPLLDDAGAPVVASFEEGRPAGWSSRRTSLDSSADARSYAAAAWLDDAAMEHASVASFGRVALELLSLGAPPELVEGAHLAALDEIRHAKTCLSLAQACGSKALEPGPLAPVPQRRTDFARFAADTFIEGCVGESVAALVVTRAAAGAAESSVGQALEEIAADEARHAALAWRMVSWAIERGGAPVLAAVVEAADALRPGSADDESARLEPEGIGQLGRLSGSELALARRDAWAGIIEPMLTTLQSDVAAA